MSASSDVLVSAFYHFIKVEPDSLSAIRERLVSFADASGLKGLIVLGSEGINATVAGSTVTIKSFETLLPEFFPGAAFTFKHSIAERAPFPGLRSTCDLRSSR